MGGLGHGSGTGSMPPKTPASVVSAGRSVVDPAPNHVSAATIAAKIVGRRCH